MAPPKLLLLTPSIGLGGGIERVSRAVEHQFAGSCARLDLQDDTAVPDLSWLRVRAGFGRRAVGLSLRNRLDVVLAMHIGLLPVARAAAAAARVPVALLAHGREIWPTFGHLRRRLVQQCDSLIAVSTFTADVLARRAGVQRAHVNLVPLAVDAALLARARAVSTASPRAPTILTVSRLVTSDRYKGHFAVADALPAAVAVRPDLRWVVVGEGDDLPFLRAYCAARGLEHVVHFRGKVSDEELATLYRTSSALVMPSITDVAADPPTGEGFGLVYAEAGAFAVPSIASTSSGGAADFVINGSTGLTVPPGNPDLLARAVLALVSDTDLSHRLGSAARDLVESRHTPQRFGAALHSALLRQGEV